MSNQPAKVLTPVPEKSSFPAVDPASLGYSKISEIARFSSGRLMTVKQLSSGMHGALKTAAANGEHSLEQEIELWQKVSHKCPELFPSFALPVKSTAKAGSEEETVAIFYEHLPLALDGGLAVRSVAEFASMLADVCDAVEALHSCGTVHGNLSRQSFRLDKEGRVRLIDIPGNLNSGGNLTESSLLDVRTIAALGLELLQTTDRKKGVPAEWQSSAAAVLEKYNSIEPGTGGISPATLRDSILSSLSGHLCIEVPADGLETPPSATAKTVTAAEKLLLAFYARQIKSEVEFLAIPFKFIRDLILKVLRRPPPAQVPEGAMDQSDTWVFLRRNNPSGKEWNSLLENGRIEELKVRKGTWYYLTDLAKQDLPHIVFAMAAMELQKSRSGILETGDLADRISPLPESRQAFRDILDTLVKEGMLRPLYNHFSESHLVSHDSGVPPVDKTAEYALEYLMKEEAADIYKIEALLRNLATFGRPYEDFKKEFERLQKQGKIIKEANTVRTDYGDSTVVVFRLASTKP